MDEMLMDEAPPEPPRVKRKRRWAKRLGWAIAILLAPLVLAAAFLASPIGKRFVAEQIAQVAPASGLRFTVGRIEGDLYNSATLYDVTLLDPEGAFLTIPEVTLDWRPLNWLWRGLDVRELTARRGQMTRLPQLLPGDPDAPLLPDFDIRVDTFEIVNLKLAPGIAGEVEQRVDLSAQIDIRRGRTLIDANGRFGTDDAIDLLLDARPDGDRFNLALDYRAAADGPIAKLAGLSAAYDARIRGEGSWTRWLGHAVVKRQEAKENAPRQRVAALQITNNGGRYAILGEINPMLTGGGILDRAVGDAIALAAMGTLEDSTLIGRIAGLSDALDLRGKGAFDLAGNRARDVTFSAQLLDPELLGKTVRLEQALLTGTMDGRFRDLTITHRLRAGALDIGAARLEGLTQAGRARVQDGAFTIPLDVTVARVVTGSDFADPRLVGGTLRGQATFAAGRLIADNTRIAFPGLAADLSLRGDTRTGVYAIAGPIQASRITVPDVGTVGGAAKLIATFGKDTPWNVRANVNGRLASVSNATIANVAGNEVRFSGQVGLGRDQPVILRDFAVDSDRLNARFDSRLAAGRTTLTGAGRHVQYGPFTVDADIAGDALSAQLVLADPLPAAGLSNVRVGIAPSGDGLALDVAGGSLLGDFNGKLGLVLPAGGPARIAVNSLQVYRTNVTGALTIGDGGVTGRLALAGGGLNGTVAVIPAPGGATGFDIDLTAKGARFGGVTDIAIASADIDARGSFGGSAPARLSADIAGSGFTYGGLRIARFAANASVVDGSGDITASIAGRRADRFALKFDGDISPRRIALLARGEYAGRAITMPRRAVLTRQDDGGYRLAPTQIGYARGFAIVEGEVGGQQTRLAASLASMPLRLADLVGAELGLSGRLSGKLDYRQSGGAAPTASGRFTVDDFARSGLVLSSTPIDLTAGFDLGPERLRAAANFESAGTRLGRVDARITGIGGGGPLAQRIRRGQLAAKLAYNGPAQSLWRLLAVEAFDLTGPLTVSASATGTLADPRIVGQLASDDLRLQSAISGTDITNVSARGRFAGSRLELTRFAGATQGGGTIKGSGTVDLASIGGGRGPRIDIRAAAVDARIVNAAGLDATVTGPIRIVSNGVGGTIAGRVRVDRASWKLGYAAEDFALPRIATREVNLPDEIAPRTRRAGAGSWRYLVNATAPSRVAVDGLGLDSEWGVDIALRGTVSDPRIGGQANLVRGDYTFAGTRFELTRGRIRFDGDQPIDPRLDILAEANTGNVNVDIAITGNSQSPEINFSSEPNLPEEEILAQLLFGGSVTSLSATDAVQLGAALASLRGGGGGLDPIGRLRESIGLDQLRIVSADPALGRSTGVALGKNLGRKFYVEIITDGRGYSATQVEYRITRWLALLGTVTTIGRDRVGAEISRDY